MQAEKAGEMGNADFLRLAAEEAELKRARERLTLKHRNTSQWARRALRRGINVMDEGRAPSSETRLRHSCTAASKNSHRQGALGSPNACACSPAS